MVSGADLSALRSDFEEGAGSELLPDGGKPPKFCAAFSSSALVANAFGPFRARPGELRLFGRSGFTDARFEAKCSTGLGGTPPHLDFLARAPDAVLAVESKCLEYLAPKPGKFSDRYEKFVGGLLEQSWQRVYEALKSDPEAFSPLDAAQLVKHYLGLRNTYPGTAVTLAYVFWEPLGAVRSAEPFASHRDALRRFADATVDSDVTFESSSYPELIEEWPRPDSPEWLLGHAMALRARYCLKMRRNEIGIVRGSEKKTGDC